MNADQIISNRAGTHGDYVENATISQYLKDVMRGSPGYNKLGSSQRESLDLIATKVARIIAGDNDFKEHWDDIAGYARLISIQLENKRS